MFSTKERATVFEIYTMAKHLPPENTFEMFRELCFNGIPDQFRAVSWKLLMDILPFDDRDSWPDVLHNDREAYYELFDEYIQLPDESDLEYLKSRDETQTSKETIDKTKLIGNQ